MKKLTTIITITLFLNEIVYGTQITHNDYTSGAVITASGQNTNENNIVNTINGNLDNGNIAASAAIAVNKLASMTASQLTFTDSSGFLTTANGSITSGSTMTFTGGTTLSTLTFAPTSNGIKGTTTNDNVSTGYVGEYISSTTAITLFTGSSNQYVDLISLTVTAGDWEITGQAEDNNNPGATTGFTLAISTIAGNNSTLLVTGDNKMDVSINNNSAASRVITIAGWRLSTPVSANVYLKHSYSFSSGSPEVNGARLSARRLR